VRHDILDYYQRELNFLHQKGSEFARQHERIASTLLLDEKGSGDPHVERLLQAFAFLAAHIQLKIDDDFPEIVQALLGAVHPHYTRPIPSMSVVEFQVDPTQGRLSTGLTIPRESLLYSNHLVDGEECKFRTCYETTVWPLKIKDARWTTPSRLNPMVSMPKAAAILILQLECSKGARLDQIGMDCLRLYLNGDEGYSLYELLCNNCLKILVRRPGSINPEEGFALSPTAVRAVGFEDNEAALPERADTFTGYRLLLEYFAFPEKFLFLDLHFRETPRMENPFVEHGFGEEAEVVFFMSRIGQSDRQHLLEQAVHSTSFRLGCAPIINLFSQSVDGMRVDGTKYEVPIVPDARRLHPLEVFSVDRVSLTEGGSGQTREAQPFFAQKGNHRNIKPLFWYATRRTASESENPALMLSLVDLDRTPAQSDVDYVSARCTCTNGSLPSRLLFGRPEGDFQLEGASAIAKIVALRKPATSALEPPMGGAKLWRLVSQLSLNYLSLVQEGETALRETLQLHDFRDSREVNPQIAGIIAVKCRPHVAPIRSRRGLARGWQVDITFDEDNFIGASVFLFASVLERFLSLYVSLNSFSQLIAKTTQREEVLKQWTPRAGTMILL